MSAVHAIAALPLVESKGLACLIMGMYTAVAQDSVGGAGAAGVWSKCMVCFAIVKGGFPKRLMHLLGNSKTGGGAGYPKETWPACEFFSKPYKNMMHKLWLLSWSWRSGSASA